MRIRTRQIARVAAMAFGIIACRAPAQTTIESLNLAVDATITQFTALPLSKPLDNLADRGAQLFDYTSGEGARWAGAQQTVQPVFSWATDQQVQFLRVMRDNTGNNLDQVVVDTLVSGGNPTIAGDWVQRYDSGPGLSGPQDHVVDIDLGAAFVTRGVRLSVSINAPGDMYIAEIEIYGPEISAPLDILRVTPSSWSASSTAPGTAPQFAGQFGDRWLSLTTGDNPGDFFALDRTFSSATLNTIWVGFRNIFDGATVPGQWILQADTGAGFVDVETFATQLALTKYDFATLSNVQGLRVKVMESEVPAGGRIAVGYSETYDVLLAPPTPCADFLNDILAAICSIDTPASAQEFADAIAAIVADTVVAPILGSDELTCEGDLLGQVLTTNIANMIQGLFD